MKKISVKMADGLHKKVGHIAVDEDVTKAGVCRSALLVFLELRPALPALRARAKKEGVPLDTLITQLLSA